MKRQPALMSQGRARPADGVPTAGRHAILHANRRPRGPERRHIERHRHEYAIGQRVNELAIDHAECADGLNAEPGHLPFLGKRCDAQLGLTARPVPDGEEHRLAVGKHARPLVAQLVVRGVDFRELSKRPPRSADPEQPLAALHQARSGDDLVVDGPVETAAHVADLRQCRRRALERGLHQGRTPGNERDRLPIG